VTQRVLSLTVEFLPFGLPLERVDLLVPNPFDVLSEHDLLPSIVELDRATVCVISDVLGSLECATFISEPAEPGLP
jgi:hypothetical protein